MNQLKFPKGMVITGAIVLCIIIDIMSALPLYVPNSGGYRILHITLLIAALLTNLFIYFAAKELI